MSEEKVLTKEIAEQLYKNFSPGSEYFEQSKFTDIFSASFSLRNELIKFTEIEDQAAEVLSKYSGGLHLDGLLQLSETSSKHLSRHGTRTLSLNGICELSESVSINLSKYAGDLSLNGVLKISDEVAEKLSDFKGRSLCLDGLTHISDLTAKSLAKCKGGKLYLDGLLELNDSVAESFSGRKLGNLSVRGLKKISPLGLEKLSNVLLPMQKAQLAESVSEDSASPTKDQSQFTSEENTGKALTRDILERLISEKVALDLEGYDVFDPDSIAALLEANQQDEIYIGPKEEGVFEFLARRFNFNLSQEVVSNYWAFDIDGSGFFDFSEDYRSVDLEALKILTKEIDENNFSGPVSLGFGGLESLSLEQARELSKVKISGWLYLDGLKEIDADVASALSASSAMISLDGLSTMSDAVASKLQILGLLNLNEKCVESLSGETLKMLKLS
jgi:hypothetical protein